MSERLFYAFALIAVCAIGLSLVRRQSPTSLPVLTLGISILCGIFYPLGSIWITPLSWRNIPNLSEESIVGSQVDYLAFGVGLVTAILIGGLLWKGLLKPAPKASNPTRRVVFRDTLIVWGLVSAGALLYGTYVAKIGLGTLVSTHDFADKYLASRGLGVFILGLNVMIFACLWSEASPVSKRTKWFMRAVAIGIFIWATFFIAVRTYSAAMIIGFLVIYARDRRVQLRHIRPRLVIMLIAAYLGMEGFAILRSTWRSTGDLGAAIQLAQRADKDETFGAVVGGSELSHPFLTMAELTQYEEAGALMGRSYLDAVLSFVPLFIWDERPETLAQVYVAKYYPEVDERGGGTAFTFVGEAWWNFGHIFGPWLMGTALGLFLLFCQHRAVRRSHGLINRALPYCTHLVMLFHRTQVSATFKQVMSVMLPALALAIFAELLWQVLLSHRVHPTPPPRPGGRQLSPQAR